MCKFCGDAIKPVSYSWMQDAIASGESFFASRGRITADVAEEVGDNIFSSSHSFAMPHL